MREKRSWNRNLRLLIKFLDLVSVFKEESKKKNIYFSFRQGKLKILKPFAHEQKLLF
jgi:hypothetical protein